MSRVALEAVDNIVYCFLFYNVMIDFLRYSYEGKLE